MKNKIILIGTYSSLNKGDFAMHQALIKEILKRIPDVNFNIFSPFPELDHIRYSQYFNFNSHIIVEKERLRNPFNAIYLNLCSYAGIDKIFKDYDTVIDVSGDAIGEGYSIKNTIFRFLYLNLFKNLKKKIIISPQSVGPFTYSKSFFNKIFHHVDKIYVRDPLSYKYLQDFELKNIAITGDLAFMLDKCETVTNKHYLDKIRNMSGLKIGLNLSYLIGKHFAKRKTDADMIKFGIKLCNRIYSQFNDANIIFIPHVFGPENIKNDVVFGKLICYALPEILKDKFIFIEDEMDHEELKAIISETAVFIGARMHACIGAISTGTPFVNIAYSDKSVGLISQYVGLPELCIDIRKMKNDDEIINKIITGMDFALDDKDKIKKILTTKSSEFKKRSEESIEEICEIIKKC